MVSIDFVVILLVLLTIVFFATTSYCVRVAVKQQASRDSRIIFGSQLLMLAILKHNGGELRIPKYIVEGVKENETMDFYEDGVTREQVFTLKTIGEGN